MRSVCFESLLTFQIQHTQHFDLQVLKNIFRFLFIKIPARPYLCVSKYFLLKKHGLPILFTFLYVMAMLRPVLPVFDYIVNQDYIAEYLCINKDKPMLNCNGKCYLSMMIQEEQNEKKHNLPAIDLKEYPIGFVDILFCDFSEQIITKKALPFMLIREPNPYVGSVFHPPNV